MRRAPKGPRAPGRLRKSLTPLNALFLEGSVGCGAREQVSELRGGSGAAPEETAARVCLYFAASGRADFIPRRSGRPERLLHAGLDVQDPLVDMVLEGTDLQKGSQVVGAEKLLMLRSGRWHDAGIDGFVPLGWLHPSAVSRVTGREKMRNRRCHGDG